MSDLPDTGDLKSEELVPLEMVRDNYRKVIPAMNTNATASAEGIEIIKLMDFPY